MSENVGDVRVTLYPVAGSVVQRASSSKGQSHQRVLVGSDLPGVGLFGTTPAMKAPSWVLPKKSLMSAWLVGWFFTLTNDSMETKA